MEMVIVHANDAEAAGLHGTMDPSPVSVRQGSVCGVDKHVRSRNKCSRRQRNAKVDQTNVPLRQQAFTRQWMPCFTCKREIEKVW
jgi:hypothetical protein